MLYGVGRRGGIGRGGGVSARKVKRELLPISITPVAESRIQFGSIQGLRSDSYPQFGPLAFPIPIGFGDFLF